MAKSKRATPMPPRRPEKKWGPFHGGVGVVIWLNQVETELGTRWFRSVAIQPRRFLDRKTGQWKDAKSLRTTDLPALMLAMDAAVAYCTHTPLPGQPAEPDDEVTAMDNGEVPAEELAGSDNPF